MIIRLTRRWYPPTLCNYARVTALLCNSTEDPAHSKPKARLQRFSMPNDIRRAGWKCGSKEKAARQDARPGVQRLYLYIFIQSQIANEPQRSTQLAARAVRRGQAALLANLIAASWTFDHQRNYGFLSLSLPLLQCPCTIVGWICPRWSQHTLPDKQASSGVLVHILVTSSKQITDFSFSNAANIPLLFRGLLSNMAKFDPSTPLLFRNPIIPGFNPDPTICMVPANGDLPATYFLSTSTFEYFPGCAIYTSTDLMSWRLIGHALTRRSQIELRTVEPGAGSWASTLRYRVDEKRWYLANCLFQRYRPASDVRRQECDF